MNLQRFISWCETAGSRDRSEGFIRLAEAVLDDLPKGVDLEDAVSSLLVVLDDPSPKVRLVVAEVVGLHPRAPVALVRGFLFDAETIALAVAFSPVLTSADLLDALSEPGERLHCAIASRLDITSKAVSVIAERGTATATAALLRNAHADVSDLALRRIAERHGSDAKVRALLAERRIAPDIRQTLILELGQALQSSSFVSAVLGSSGRRVVFDACERATALVAETMQSEDAPAFAEHLRESGQLSAAFLLRTAAQGNINLLAASLTALSGLSERRVRSILVECRKASFHTLAKTCGLSVWESDILLSATRHWKEIAMTGSEPMGSDVIDLVMRRLIAEFSERATAESFEALQFLSRLRRENARSALRQRTRHLLAA